MFCKSIILVACLVGFTLGDSAPAFIWGSSSASRPALQTVSQDEFADLLEPYLKDSMIVAFLEPELSNSDFACSKVKSEDSCYSNLKGVTPRTYYGSVQNPTEALRQISANREFATIDDAGNLENEIVYEIGKVVFVSFETQNTAVDRDEVLEFHDTAMSKVYNQLAEKGTITAVYTRTQSTDIGKSRRRRATAATENGNVFRSSNAFLLYYTTLAVQESPATTTTPATTTQIAITSMSLSGQNNTAFTVNLVGAGNQLNFLITLSEGYFMMSNLNLNGEAFYVLPAVNAPTNFSYYCGNQTFSSQSTSKVILWNSLQMQAPFNAQADSAFVFGDPWYCVGFFTPGILAGLFVVIILLAIMGVGICWMMDINTMDRFDDPKGKTITINVTD